MVALEPGLEQRRMAAPTYHHPVRDPVLVLARCLALPGGRVGFHIAIPVYTVLYLVVFGKMKWYWTIIPAIFFEIIIVAIYGYILLAEWGTPVARDWPVFSSIWDGVIDAWHGFYEANIES